MLTKKASYWLLLPSLLFALLAVMVVNGWHWPPDSAIPGWLQARQAPWLDTAMSFFSWAGDGLTVMVLSGLLAVGLSLWANRKSDALLVLTGGIGAVLLNPLLKACFQRQRPEALPGLDMYAFPSGHAMASAALALVLVMVAWRSRWRWLVSGLAGAFILLVGASRLYLGVHYPSDIIAGWCAAALWVALASWLAGRRFAAAPQKP